MKIQNITELWDILADKYKNDIAMICEENSFSLTFAELEGSINSLSSVLSGYNIAKNSKMCLCMKNLPYWIVIEQAVMKSGLVAVSADSSAPVAEIEYILKDSDSVAIFLDNDSLLKKFTEESNLPNLKFIFYSGDSDISSFNNSNLKIIPLKGLLKNKTEYSNTKIEIAPDDMACIIYTSGTTGEPKGIVFSHENLLEGFLNYNNAAQFSEKDVSVSILPLSHIAPKLNDYSLLANGNLIRYTTYLNFISDIKKYKPKYILCVPKLVDMIRFDCNKKLESKSKLFRFLYNFSYSVSKKLKRAESNPTKNFREKMLVSFLSVFHKLAYKNLYSKIANQILNSGSIMISFGAFIPENLEMFFAVHEIPVLSRYGLTEAGGYISCSVAKNKRFGSVGKPVDNIEVVICNPETFEKLENGKTGLILAKGKQITKGYYRKGQIVGNLLPDGYLNSGDLGYLSSDNFLYFVGRDKDLIVLNNGENVNPNELEEICLQSDFVKQIIITGQDKPYLTAIVVPEGKYIEDSIENQTHKMGNINENEAFKKAVLIDINNLIGKRRHVRWIEQIKNVFFVTEQFKIENGFLTTKMKLKRNKIYNKYKNEIENMYN